MPLTAQHRAGLAYHRRRDLNETWANIALSLGYSGESAARAAAQRHARVNGLQPLTSPSATRSAAAALAAAARWRPDGDSSHLRGWTFGVELEFVGLSRRTAAEAMSAVLGYHVHLFSYHGEEGNRGCQLCGQRPDPAAKYSHWKVEEDGSVSTRQGYPNGTGGEAISPILTIERISEITKVTRALVDAGAKVDRRCGLHVHIGVKNRTRRQRANIIKVWSKNQEAVKQFVSRSRWNGTYSRDIPTHMADRYIDMMYQGEETRHTERYHSLNIRPFSKIGTFEVRLHQGTLNGKKIEEWAVFLIGLFTYAANAYGQDAVEVQTGGELIDTLENQKVLRKGNGVYWKKRAATLAHSR